MPKSDRAHVYRAYNDIVDWFDSHRDKSLRMERDYLDLIRQHLPPRASIVDVGCGAAEPMAAFFIKEGHQVLGVDASHKMIALCRKRFPEQRWLCEDIRTFTCAERFDLVLAWHSLFHLPVEHQRTTLRALAKWVKPAGLLVLTTGESAGEQWSDNGGVELYHACLAMDEYREILTGCGLTIVKHVVGDPSCGFATVWVAQK